MAHLMIEQPGIPPMKVDLEDDETSFGRAEDNSVVLLADEVSRYHAKIHFRHGEILVDDLKSLNGTYVNQQRVVERVLADRDEVWFGSKCRATFHDDPEDLRNERKKQSSLAVEVDKIRDEMDSMTQQMSMIGRAPQHTIAATPRAADVDQMQRAFRRLNALYKATQLISSEFDLDKRLAQVLDLAMEEMDAQRGFLMMRDEDAKTLQVKVARAMGQELTAGSPSTGIAQRAAIEGEPVLMADSGADQQFGGRESIMRLQIKSAMCVPLRIDNRILGSLYVDSSKAGQRFDEEDLELFQAIANQSAMAIENVRLYDQMLEAEKKRANFGRFLSPGIVEMLMQDDRELELGGQKGTVTIMFCDIRGFTPLSEGLTPDRLVEFLNQHFTAMTEIVFQNKGTLDKYIGDEVMALFGAPFASEDDPILGVRAAIAMQQRNKELNEGRVAEGFPPFEIGIGINTGEVFTGYVGSPDRMDFSVIGDHVNIAARLCSIAGPGQIIIGEQTYEATKDMITASSAGTQTLKGKRETVRAYQVTG